MTASIRIVNTSNWDQTVLVEQEWAEHGQHLARGEVSDPIGVPHEGTPITLHVRFGQEHDTKHPGTGSPYLGEVNVTTDPCTPEPSLPPITETLKRDALETLSRTLQARQDSGVEDGTRPVDWSDDAQTVGWCRDLMERWPKDQLRLQMAGLLSRMGYPEYLPGEGKSEPAVAA